MKFSDDIVNVIKQGGVGIIPTDTLYGLVGLSTDRNAVDKIINLKGMKPERKGFVVLISQVDDLKMFGVQLNARENHVLHRIWPGPFSVVFDVNSESGTILHFSSDAFRIPDNQQLRELISKTGPLIAPSANTTGNPPSHTIEEAKKYFGDKVDFYIDGGELHSAGSTVMKILDNDITIFRMGDKDPRTML